MTQTVQQEQEAYRLFRRAVEAYEEDEYPAALPLFEHSLALNRALGNLEAAAAIHLYLGQIAIALDDPGRAQREFSSAYDILGHLGDRAGQGRARLELGELMLDLGEVGVGEKHFREALDLLCGTGESSSLAHAYTRLGHLAFEQQDRAAARNLYEQALVYYERAEDTLGVAGATVELANCLEHEDPERARRLFQVGRDLAQSVGNDYLASVAVHGLGVLHADAGEWAAARRFYQTALDLKKRVEDREGQAFTYLALAAAEEALDHLSAAQAAWRIAAELAEEQGLVELAALAREELESTGLSEDPGQS